MFGFLLKIGIVAALVVGGGYFVKQKYGSIPNPQTFMSQVKSEVQHADVNNLTQNLGSSLDSLVTHQDKNSPVVLGVKISNDSLDTVVNVIQNLPPDQVNQVKALLCAPVPTNTPTP